MGRIAHFNNEQFLDAALKIAAESGPSAVTIAAIAGEIGATVGSVYHRFPSRDILLAEAWLKVASSFQKKFLQLLKKRDGLEAALYTPRWVRSHPADSRILLLYRREELAGSHWPDELKERALRIKHDLDSGIREYVIYSFGKYDQGAARRAVFVLVDVPYAAVIRYIRLGKRPPKKIDEYIRQIYPILMERK